jgi:hypothetical protein
MYHVEQQVKEIGKQLNASAEDWEVRSAGLQQLSALATEIDTSNLPDLCSGLTSLQVFVFLPNFLILRLVLVLALLTHVLLL